MSGEHFLDQRRWFVASPYYRDDTGHQTRDITVVWALTTRQASVEGIRAMNKAPEKNPWTQKAKRAGVDVIAAMNVWPVDTDEFATIVATRGAVAVLQSERSRTPVQVR